MKLMDLANSNRSAKPGKPKKTFVASLVFLFLVLFVFIFIFPLYTTSRVLVSDSQLLLQAARSQNIDQIQAQLTAEQKSLNSFQGALNRAFWAQWIPFAGAYWSDASHGAKAGQALLQASQLSVQAIAPYADIIGLKGNHAAGSGQEKAQDRINFVVSTIDKLAPQLDSIGAQLKVANTELGKINPNRYPENFKGFPLRSELAKGIDTVSEVSLLTNEARPVLEEAPWILGNDKKRTYLVLFQNDAELRPTGGFWTGYAVLTVDKGKITPLYSSDIYDLDAIYHGTKPAPQPLIDYIADPYKKEQLAGKTPAWRLRDMNLSPDFRVAVETFLPEYLTTGRPSVDGVIGIDSQVLVDLLKVLGSVGVPGYGNFSADNDPHCNCPEVIYQLESIIGVVTPYIRENRKGVLGPLMNSVLANAAGSPKDKLPGLFEAGLNSLLEKHVMFYFTDPKAQQAIESFNLGDRVRETSGDYLYVVDSNMAGAKTNLYVEETVSDSVQADANTATHTLTVSYKNSQQDDRWLNGLYRDWFRVYVPKGSKLVDNSGSEIPVKVSEDLGKTVFEGFFTMRPLGVAKLTFKYTTPAGKQNYSLLVQKQGGTPNFNYSVTLNGQKTDFALREDKELTLK